MTTIQFRRGTASEWTAANPTLSSGEPGFETDTGREKVGTGAAAWNSLPYFGPPSTVLDIRDPAFGGKVDGELLPGATTTASTATTVQFAAAHGIVSGDVGKTGWVLDSTGNGTYRTITTINSTTQITLSGQCGKAVTAGGFVYGTPIDTALAAALTVAAGRTVVDTTAGANRPWGPVSATEVFVGGGTGIAIMTAQAHVQYGTRFNNDGIIFGGNLTASPFFDFDSNTSIGRLSIDVGPGFGIIVGDSVGAQDHFSWERIEVWGRGSATGAHLIQFNGLDLQGGQIWTKGGDTAVRCVSGTDSNLGHIFTIGAKTGLSISGGSQITVKQFSDSCQCACRIWGGADNVSVDTQLFINSASPSSTCPGVIFGVKDDASASTILNQNIVLDIQMRDTGAPAVSLAYCSSVKVRGQLAPRMNGGAIVQSARGQMTGVAYGTSVGDGIDVDLSFPSFGQFLNDGTTPAYVLYTGTPTGQYVARFDNKIVHVAGPSYALVGGTTTVPVVSQLVEEAMVADWFHLLTVGTETIPGARAFNSSNTIAMATGTSRLTYFVARKTEAWTQVKVFSGSTVSSALTVARLAVHQVNSDGSTTVLATTTHDGALFAATSTAYTKSLSGTVNAVRGNHYALELLLVGTPGNVTGVSAFSGAAGTTGLAAHLKDDPRVALQINGQADIGTGYTTAAIAAATNAGASTSAFYAVLLP
jgi:hypothetical protein